MRSLAKIVKDKNNDVYLKVYNEKVKVLAYFLIQPYDTTLEGKIEDLTDTFSIDLGGRK